MFAPTLCNAFCCLYLSWDVAHLNLPTWSVHPACRIKSSCVRDLHAQKMVEIHAASRSFFFLQDNRSPTTVSKPASATWKASVLYLQANPWIQRLRLREKKLAHRKARLRITIIDGATKSIRRLAAWSKPHKDVLQFLAGPCSHWHDSSESNINLLLGSGDLPVASCCAFSSRTRTFIPKYARITWLHHVTCPLVPIPYRSSCSIPVPPVLSTVNIFQRLSSQQNPSNLPQRLEPPCTTCRAHHN